MTNVHDKADSTILAHLNLGTFASLFTANVQMETAVLRFLISNSSSDKAIYLAQQKRASTLMMSLHIDDAAMTVRIELATTIRMDTFGQIMADPDRFRVGQAMTSYFVVTDAALFTLNSDLKASTEYQFDLSKQQMDSMTRTTTLAVSLQAASEFLMAALYFAFLFAFRQKIVQLTDSKSQLEAEQAFSKKAMRAKRDFMTVISHELRTPLNGAIGMLQMLLESGLDNDHQTSVLVAAESLGCLLVLIESLLDLRALRTQSEYGDTHLQHSKSDDTLSSHQLLHDRSSEPEERWEPGCGKLVLAPVNINALMIELSESFKPHMTLKGIEFCTEMLDLNSFPYRVLTNKARLKQALGNLLSNAQKFTSAHGHVRFIASVVGGYDHPNPPISLNSHTDQLAITIVEDITTMENNGGIPCVESSLSTPSQHCVVGHAKIRFEIIDDGIGIADEHLESIFQPFSRLDQSLTRESDGVGVGLGISSPPIAWQLSRQLKGSLCVKSAINEGTVMSLEIDVDLVNATAPTPSSASTPFTLLQTPSVSKTPIIHIATPGVAPVVMASDIVITIGSVDASSLAIGPSIVSGTIELQHLEVLNGQPHLMLECSPDISGHASLMDPQLNENSPPLLPCQHSVLSLNSIFISPKTAPITSSMKAVASSRTMPRNVSFSPMLLANPLATTPAIPMVRSLPAPLPPALVGYRARHFGTTAPPLPVYSKLARDIKVDGPSISERDIHSGPSLARCLPTSRSLPTNKINPTDTIVTPGTTPCVAAMAAVSSTPSFSSILCGETPRFARSLHVLLAEDNLLNQRFDVMLMKKLGHTFLLVENGLEAVNAVLAYWKSVDAAKAAFGNGEFVGTSSVPIVMMHKFDICLMDISMPVMDGLVAAATIRAFEISDPKFPRTRLPIIACTAHTDDDMRLQIFASGMQEVVEKPIIKNVLVEKMILLTECSSNDSVALTNSQSISPVLASGPNDPSPTVRLGGLRITTMIAQSPQITNPFAVVTPRIPLGFMSVSPPRNSVLRTQQSLTTMVEVDVVESARVQLEEKPISILFTGIKPLKPTSLDNDMPQLICTEITSGAGVAEVATESVDQTGY